VTQPGIPNDYSLSTACYGTRLRTIEDQAFAAVAMGFRRIEFGLSEEPVPLNGFEETRRETGIEVGSLVCGCLNPHGARSSGLRLGSLDEDQRERALISVRRHIQVAKRYSCPVVIVRGCEIENPALRAEAEGLRARELREGNGEELSLEAIEFEQRVQKKAHRQVEHLCRCLHTLLQENPGVQIALEPGLHFNEVLGFEAMGWALEDLARHGLRYWHDTGAIELRGRVGLQGQGAWLDAYADRMAGAHLQDAAGEELGMPPGTGEVDFRLVAGYMPSDAERVLELDPRHGRAEILGAVQFLSDRGF
jgi:sugar phosphate isomerase/epimerase